MNGNNNKMNWSFLRRSSQPKSCTLTKYNHNQVTTLGLLTIKDFFDD